MKVAAFLLTLLFLLSLGLGVVIAGPDSQKAADTGPSTSRPDSEEAADAPHSTSSPETGNESSTTTKPVSRTVFAVPFENETKQEQYYPAAEGMADLIAVILADQKYVKVVERQRLEDLTKEQARTLAGLTGDKYAVQAGKLVEADTVLTGRLFLVEGKLTVNVKALDIATARVVASGQVSCRPSDIVEASLQLSRQLSRQMSLPLPEIDPKQIDSSPIASLHFNQALGYYYTGNLDPAIMQFMRAIDLDPDYTESNYWCGVCYYRLGEYSHSAIELKQFLKREPDSRYAASAKRMLADAEDKEKQSGVPSLGPEDIEKKEPGQHEEGASEEGA